MTSVADIHHGDDAHEELSGISPELVLVDPELARLVRERETTLGSPAATLPPRTPALRLVPAPASEPAIVPRALPAELPAVEHTAPAVEPAPASEPPALPRRPIPPPLAEPVRRPARSRRPESAPPQESAATRDAVMPHPVARPSAGPRSTSGSSSRARTAVGLIAGVAATSLAVLGVLQLTDRSSETSPTQAGPQALGTPPASREAAPKSAAAAKPRTPKAMPAPSGTTRASTRLPATRRFVWAPVEGATGYHVELFKGAQRVLAKETKRPVLELGRTWRYDGRTMTLTPGAYRWYVWPVTKSGRAAEAIVQAKLTV